MKHAISALKAILVIPLTLCLAPPVVAEESAEWHGTLYRNGGHFGEANSDERLEYGLPVAVAPCSDFAPLTFDTLVSVDDAWDFDDTSSPQTMSRVSLKTTKP